MLVLNKNILTIGGNRLEGGPLTPPGPVDPYNPLGLPPNTVRVRTSDGNEPSAGSWDSATLVSGTSDVYDVYKSGTDFAGLLMAATNVVEVLGANTTGITNMENMFLCCYNLPTVSIFDTSNVTNMYGMFQYCGSLTTVLLFNTSKVTDMRYMFSQCSKVQSGALALYQQASTQTNPPSNHSNAFQDCGRNSPTGAAELAQIPSDWGGTGA